MLPVSGSYLGNLNVPEDPNTQTQKHGESLLEVLLSLTDREILGKSWNYNNIHTELNEIKDYLNRLASYVPHQTLRSECLEFSLPQEFTASILDLCSVKKDIHRLMLELVDSFVNYLTKEQIETLQEAIPNRPKFLENVFKIAVLKWRIQFIFNAAMTQLQESNITELKSLLIQLKDLKIASYTIDCVRKTFCEFVSPTEEGKRNLFDIKFAIINDIADPEIKKLAEASLSKDMQELYQAGKDKSL